MNDLFIDMSLSVLLSTIRTADKLGKWERAFRKLYVAIGLAYGWNVTQGPNTELQTKVLP